MNYGIIQPPQRLSDYIRFFWFSEANASIHNPFVHHAFAYPCPEIIFCYKGQFKFNIEFEPEKNLISGIYGQTQTFSKITSKADFGAFGFYLYPHALPQLFHLPASEITNQSTDIKSFCGKEGEILEEKIMLALSNEQRVKIVCDFLEARLKNVKPEYTKIFSSTTLMSRSSNMTSIQALADDSFLSMRQFERRFKQFSGFSPKLFLRIKRFNSALKKACGDSSLTQIAIECGYYDQSHFIHDFRKFSGHNPKEYFRPETVPATDRGTVEFEM
ncbi:helix-turn-helix domain-containing protein [Flavitalea sp. BT771]|uniref:AraC family transcriptional regulator n=1 Tax=Flavitalea sp. BT771 TaxID=3063329 RepID=UPI0026E1D80D|nr:helix-turn-helix domain-containing protein [Flavitalea sp. BT771]MDO6433645.1 helix-turn-helix domain-containing protein [Flavitalea sp. BT771]MDV6222450.1 helix-turn-helix domain-containing protein [Flavitalea sp. BT771]